ncbi:MAG: hypothetical protein ACE5GJ_03485 [Gemmatimonadota bacterium]
MTKPDTRLEDAGADEAEEVGDGTLAGYFHTHDRPPAFAGPDGHPYTVSIEVEQTADPRTPFEGYLVFPRWAESGLGILGHVESPTLHRGRTSQEVVDALGGLALVEVKTILDAAVAVALSDDPDAPISHDPHS